MAQEQQPLILEREVQVISELTGEVFQHLERYGIPRALEKTLQAGKEPATMPEVMHYRINNHDPRLWNLWFTTMSEESVGQNPQRIKLNTSDPVYVLAHGDAAVLKTPERIRGAFEEGLTKEFAARLSEPELNLVLSGYDRQFPVLTIDELFEQTETDPQFGWKTRSYVVVAPFTRMQKTVSGYQSVDDLRENELVAVRAGGKVQANAFLDKAGQVWNTKKIGNWHRFREIDPQEHQARLLFLGDVSGGGLYGGSGIDNYRQFLGVRQTIAEGAEKFVEAKP